MREFITERVRFPGAQGDWLDARLERPPGAVRAYALFAHCFTCSMSSIAATRISRALAERGIGVLRFDFTGLGGSEGAFADTTFSSNVADLGRAAGYLRAQFSAPQLLIGHSLGGAAILASAFAIPEVRACATIAAPSEPEHLLVHFPQALPEIEATGEAMVTIGGRAFIIRRQFVEDIRAQRLLARLPQLGRAVMIFHSPQDDVVEYAHAERLFAAAAQPKSLISLSGADHLLTRPQDTQFVAAVLAAWTARCLGI